VREHDREVWLGDQLDQGRKVEIVCYTGGSPAAFLADARIKQAVKDAIYVEVYEIIESGGIVAAARELLPARSLATMAKEGKQLQPVEICRILSEIAEPLRFLETHGIPWVGLSAEDVRFDDEARVRIRNVAAAANRRSTRETREKLVPVLNQLLLTGLLGSTRVQTLLDLMAGSRLRSPIAWEEIHEVARQIHRELSSREFGAVVGHPIGSIRNRGNKVLFAAALMVTIGTVGTLFLFDFIQESPASPTAVTIPAGRYPTPGDGVVKHGAFHIDATEVTIAEYGDFLRAWDRLSRKERAQLLPGRKLGGDWDMRPADWTEYYQLAKAGKKWQERLLTPDCPAIGVDWWQATVYASWKGGQLPTRRHWWAAASLLDGQVEEVNRWGPVGGAGKGPHQLASNVAEWARGRSRNPAEPDMPPRFAALGASFANKKQGPFAQEWVDSPGVTRPDLGFRVVYEGVE
jgi:hypothetical protein